MSLFSRLTRTLPLVYDPMRYWNTRQNPNAEVGEEQSRLEFDANYIRRNVADGERILELGPGIGRTFGSYSHHTEVTTLDISRIYRDKLDAVAASLGLQLQQHFLTATLDRFPFADGQFDVGVSFQVFIHQPPDVFAHNFSEMARVCRKLIVSVGLHSNTADDKKARGRHVFSHDYVSAASRHGRLLSNVLSRDGVLYFVAHADDSGLWNREK